MYFIFRDVLINNWWFVVAGVFVVSPRRPFYWLKQSLTSPSRSSSYLPRRILPRLSLPSSRWSRHGCSARGRRRANDGSSSSSSPGWWPRAWSRRFPRISRAPDGGGWLPRSAQRRRLERKRKRPRRTWQRKRRTWRQRWASDSLRVPLCCCVVWGNVIVRKGLFSCPFALPFVRFFSPFVRSSVRPFICSFVRNAACWTSFCH